jgi:hypothetical protein
MNLFHTTANDMVAEDGLTQLNTNVQDTPIVNYVVTKDMTIMQTEINCLINNIMPPILYGVKLIDVLKYLVKLSNRIIDLKSSIYNYQFKTENYADLLLQFVKNVFNGVLHILNSSISLIGLCSIKYESVLVPIFSLLN